MNGHRKLLVLAINHLVKSGQISLESKAAASVPSAMEEEKPHGSAQTKIHGETTVINWQDIGFDEIRVSVWWKYDHSQHPQANNVGDSKERFRTREPLAKRNHYPKFVGVVVTGYLDLRGKPHVEGYGRDNLHDIYTRRGEAEYLDGLPTPKPVGFEVEG